MWVKWRRANLGALIDQVSSEKPLADVSVTLPAYERRLLYAAIAGVVTIAWAYLWIEANRMGSADMATMMEMRARGVTGLSLLFLMWAIMMVAMMLPSAMPMILLQAAVMRKIENSRVFALSVGAFTGGYVLIWILFSLAATILQAYLEYLALLSPMMVSQSPVLGGLILVGAGVYQCTPAKDVCLRHCQTPLVFVTNHWRPGVGGAFRMGIHHGLFCVGCCWVLMALLFVGGVMNLLWIAIIAAFVLLEKVSQVGGRRGRTITGLCLLATGSWFWWFKLFLD